MAGPIMRQRLKFIAVIGIACATFSFGTSKGASDMRAG